MASPVSSRLDADHEAIEFHIFCRSSNSLCLRSNSAGFYQAILNHPTFLINTAKQNTQFSYTFTMTRICFWYLAILIMSICSVRAEGGVKIFELRWIDDTNAAILNTDFQNPLYQKQSPALFSIKPPSNNVGQIYIYMEDRRLLFMVRDQYHQAHNPMESLTRHVVGELIVQ
jgi:hypothetical protein